jgi:DNA-binding NarL/FixJ family response regulator
MIDRNKILIVDDNAEFRGALREFLSQEPDLQIVGEAGASGYIVKDTVYDELREGIRAVLGGGTCPSALSAQTVRKAQTGTDTCQ